MRDARLHAHPMIEPLDYDLSPDKARDVLAGDALDVYGLLWKAAIATAAEGPAITRERLVIEVAPPDASAISTYLQARDQSVEDPGWLAILPAEGARLAEAQSAPLPIQVRKALDAMDTMLDAEGTRRRGQAICTPLVPMLGAPADWHLSVVDCSPAALQFDGLVEQMATQGVGRPSTFGDRIKQAVANDLIRQGEDGLAVGDYGAKVLDALARLPTDAIVDATFCAQLETQLAEVEQSPSLAGEVLSAFCKRALGIDTGLAAWLDALEIEGESLEEAMRRAERTLPPANSWDISTLPTGLDPLRLLRDPADAAQLRASFDALLAFADTAHWKALSPRGRAVRRVAALIEATPSANDSMLKKANADLVWRWWFDLGPMEAPLQSQELQAAQREVHPIVEQRKDEFVRLGTVLTTML